MKNTIKAVLFTLCGLTAFAFSAEKAPKTSSDPRGLSGTKHSVDARVIYPNRALDPSIQAELEPGPFTIPEGYKAVDLKFRCGDPKMGYESDVLRPGNIKCVKSKRRPTKEDFKPGMELAAGEYLLIVGGFPGAQGTLTYTLVPDDSTPTPAPPNDKGHGTDRGKQSQLVSVHMKGIRITGETEFPFDSTSQAKLTIAGERFELEFELEAVRSESIVSEHSTIRWEGKISPENGKSRVSGTTREEHVWNDKWGGQGFSRGTGTFEGRLIGATWSGSMKENGETKASQADKAETYRMKAEWSIGAADKPGATDQKK